MISEIIKFSDMLGDLEITKSAKNIKNELVIIETQEKNGKLDYVNYELLDDEQRTNAFLEQNSDLEFTKKGINEFKKWINKQINLKTNNKRLGSTSGLLTSLPYVFLLTEKNKEGLLKKTEKMKSFKWKEKLMNDIFQDILEIYKKFNDRISVLNEKTMIFLLLPKKVRQCNRNAIYEKFEEERISEPPFSNDEFTIDGNCPICNNKGQIGPPREETYQTKKPFAKKTDRPDPYGMRVCRSCYFKYEKAWDKISDLKFRIIPIFIENDAEIKYIKQDQEENFIGKNFKELLIDIKNETKKDIHNFFLLALSHNEIWFYDYVYGYNFNLGNNYTRFDFEEDIWLLLTGKKYNQNYFGELETSDFSNITYQIRLKIFNFVYRADDNQISIEDIINISNITILSRIKKNSTFETIEKNVKIAIRLRNNISRWSNMIKPNEEDRKNAKKIGQLTRRILENLSESENPHRLLALIIEKHRPDQIKYALSKMLDKYNYKFDTLSDADQHLISECLSANFSIDNFDLLKIDFYAGYFLEVN